MGAIVRSITRYRSERKILDRIKLNRLVLVFLSPIRAILDTITAALLLLQYCCLQDPRAFHIICKRKRYSTEE